MSAFAGVHAAVLTPFDHGGQLDRPALEQHLDFLIAEGVDGLFVGGSTAEFPLLNPIERRTIVEIAVRVSAGRVPVIAHTGAMTTRGAIELSRHARETGADAVAAVPPWYYPLEERDLLAHYSALARSVRDHPVFLYDIPARTGNPLSPELVATLERRHQNIIGLKDSTGSLEHRSSVLRETAGRIILLSGSDADALEALRLGASGLVSGNANVFPQLLVALYRAYASEVTPTATAIQAQLVEVIRILRDGHVPMLKAAMAAAGKPLGGSRLPARRPSARAVREAVDAIRRLAVPTSREASARA